MYIDAHFHVWDISRGDYAWLTPELTAIYRDFGVDDWQREFGPLGVGAGIVVQAVPTEAETSFLLECAASRPDLVPISSPVSSAGSTSSNPTLRSVSPDWPGIRG
ncbi:putative TIM-barrel fold metal-dependent hydrolase [Paraburkholderia sp. WC7.3g]|uniref:amidohydrolase family protein n=1 Tax=Paraburkholderia TaxID=1822464 RepID=UPI0028ABC056|nr:hypothetical protein [Paraburkholderia podalyriae]